MAKRAITDAAADATSLSGPCIKKVPASLLFLESQCSIPGATVLSQVTGLDHCQKRLSLAAMNWMQLAIELTREAMNSRTEAAKPTEPTDLGMALSQQFGLIDRQMDAIVENLKAHNAKLERSIRRQRIWNYTLAVAVVAVAVIAFLR
jgi:hypothetical protein